ncbi:hypothetical protein BT69DRAFT_161551 [Atractiella rhizophila]|nr:hypothetical protein BT69DRAFT_161551 [Atractiella rhizophila]
MAQVFADGDKEYVLRQNGILSDGLEDEASQPAAKEIQLQCKHCLDFFPTSLLARHEAACPKGSTDLVIASPKALTSKAARWQRQQSARSLRPSTPHQTSYSSSLQPLCGDKQEGGGAEEDLEDDEEDQLRDDDLESKNEGNVRSKENQKRCPVCEEQLPPLSKKFYDIVAACRAHPQAQDRDSAYGTPKAFHPALLESHRV